MRERLSESDQHALHEMRREIWHGALVCGAAGFLLGVAGCQAIKRIPQLQARFAWFEPKHHFATPLFTGAFGLLVGSQTTAR